MTMLIFYEIRVVMILSNSNGKVGLYSSNNRKLNGAPKQCDKVSLHFILQQVMGLFLNYSRGFDVPRIH
jgi:hypothetical protein